MVIYMDGRIARGFLSKITRSMRPLMTTRGNWGIGGWDKTPAVKFWLDFIEKEPDEFDAEVMGGWTAEIPSYHNLETQLLATTPELSV